MVVLDYSISCGWLVECSLLHAFNGWNVCLGMTVSSMWQMGKSKLGLASNAFLCSNIKAGAFHTFLDMPNTNVGHQQSIDSYSNSWVCVFTYWDTALGCIFYFHYIFQCLGCTPLAVFVPPADNSMCGGVEHTHFIILSQVKVPSERQNPGKGPHILPINQWSLCLQLDTQKSI